MIIIDNAISSSLVRSLWAVWPDKQWSGWHHYKGRDADKYATKSRHDLPHVASLCLLEMARAVDDKVLDFTFPDFEMHGSGMHMIPSGGFLAKHLDSAVMESTGWRREYSCVLCVNPHWQDDWGGEFGIVGHDTVSPRFNRLILFRTTESSVHWVNRVTGPISRYTLSLFYWSECEPDDSTRTQARFFHD